MCVDVAADPDGRWHPKDHLAHCAWWRRRNAQLFDAVRTDGTLPPSYDDESQNDVIYQAYRDQSLAEIRELARSAWEEMNRAAESLSESDLMKPHPYATGQALWQEVCGTNFYHLGEHLTYLYDEMRDESAAEATQKWMHDLFLSVAPGDRLRGTAEYNLACFYAKRGRADEALPLLRKGIELRGDLVEWARHDTDLDPIRDDPRVADMLGTRG